MPSPERILPAKKPPAHGFRQRIGTTEISAPRVDPELVRLTVIERLTEVLRYTLRRAEHWLSPGGTLRAVLRLSLKLALLTGISVFTIGPWSCCSSKVRWSPSLRISRP